MNKIKQILKRIRNILINYLLLATPSFLLVAAMIIKNVLSFEEIKDMLLGKTSICDKQEDQTQDLIDIVDMMGEDVK